MSLQAEEYIIILERARDAISTTMSTLQASRNKINQELALLNAGGIKPLEGRKVERLVPEVHKEH